MLSLYQLIFTFLIKIITYVIDSELDESQLRRLSLVVKNCQRTNRFDLSFFTELEQQGKPSVKRKRKFVKKHGKVETKEKIVQQRVPTPEIHSQPVIETSKLEQSEIRFIMDQNLSESNNFDDNSVLTQYQYKLDDKIMKYVKIIDGKSILSESICFLLNKPYEYCSFVIFLFYMKYGINRDLYSYRGDVQLFSIHNDYVYVIKYIMDKIELLGLKQDKYVVDMFPGEVFDQIYPSYDELKNGIIKIHRPSFSTYGEYVCECKPELACQQCSKVMECLELLEEFYKTCKCMSDDCGLCSQSIDLQVELVGNGYQFQAIYNSFFSLLKSDKRENMNSSLAYHYIRDKTSFFSKDKIKGRRKFIRKEKYVESKSLVSSSFLPDTNFSLKNVSLLSSDSDSNVVSSYVAQPAFQKSNDSLKAKSFFTQ